MFSMLMPSIFHGECYLQVWLFLYLRLCCFLCGQLDSRWLLCEWVDGKKYRQNLLNIALKIAFFFFLLRKWWAMSWTSNKCRLLQQPLAFLPIEVCSFEAVWQCVYRLPSTQILWVELITLRVGQCPHCPQKGAFRLAGYDGGILSWILEWLWA